MKPHLMESCLPPTLTSSYLSATSEYGKHWRLRVLLPLAPNVALVENDITATGWAGNVQNSAVVQNYVVKRVPYTSEEELVLLRKEAETWAQLSSLTGPNVTAAVNPSHSASCDVVPLLDYFIFNQLRLPAVVFLMRYLPNPQLPLPLSEEKILRLLAKLTATLEALERAGHEFHGNITRSTLLLDAGERPKLAGFGLTRAKAQGGVSEDLKALASIAENTLGVSEDVIPPRLRKIMNLLRAENPNLVTIRYEIAAARGLVPDVDVSLASRMKDVQIASSSDDIREEEQENAGKEAHNSGEDSSNVEESGKRRKKKRKKRKAENGILDEKNDVNEDLSADSKREPPENPSKSSSKEQLAESADGGTTKGNSLDIRENPDTKVSSKERVALAEPNTASDSHDTTTATADILNAAAPEINNSDAVEPPVLEELVKIYPHGSQDALQSVVKHVTDKDLDSPLVCFLEWIIEEVECRVEALNEIFKLLYKRPISKNPIIAFKTLLLIHSLHSKDSQQIFDMIHEQEAFLGWIAKVWSPSEIQQRIIRKKRRPYVSCFVEGDITMYAEALRNTAGDGFSPESMYSLLKVFAGAQDECKIVKHAAIPFLLRDLAETTFVSESLSVIRNRQDVMNVLDKRLLQRFGLSSMLKSGIESERKRKGKKKRKKSRSRDLQDHKVKGAERDTGGAEERLVKDREDVTLKDVSDASGGGLDGSPAADRKEDLAMEPSQPNGHVEVEMTRSGSLDDRKSGHKEKNGSVRIRKKKKKKEEKLRQEESKRATSKIVNILLTRDREYPTSDEDSSNNNGVVVSIEKPDVSNEPLGTAPAMSESLHVKKVKKKKGGSVRSRSRPVAEDQTHDSLGTSRVHATEEELDEGIRREEEIASTHRRSRKNSSHRQPSARKKTSKRHNLERYNQHKEGVRPAYTAELKTAIATGSKTPKMNPAYEVMPHEVQLERPVGSGGFGVVYKGHFRGRVAAIKKVHAHALRNPACVAEFQSEVAVLCTLRHENIIEFLGACSRPPNLMIITEFMANGTLFDLLHRSQMKVTWSMRRSFALDICRGMKYLHDCKMLHRDLKSSNLMLGENFSCKVGDFGLARISVSSNAAPMTGQCGTFQYMAPEVLANKPYSEKADVFSFGILLWEMVDRRLPYFGMKPMQVALAVLNQGLRPPVPPNCPRPLRWLMEQCWSQDPLQRPSFAEVSRILEQMPP